MLLILANVFIAILSEAYATVAADLAENAKSSSHFFGKIKKKLTSKVGKFKQELDMIDDDGDGMITATELAEATNVSLERAQQVIDENDQNGDGTLDISEFGRLKRKLLQEKEERERTISLYEFNQLKSDLSNMTKLMGECWMDTPSGQRELQKKGNVVDSDAEDLDYLEMVDEMEEQ